MPKITAVLFYRHIFDKQSVSLNSDDKCIVFPVTATWNDSDACTITPRHRSLVKTTLQPHLDPHQVSLSRPDGD